MCVCTIVMYLIYISKLILTCQKYDMKIPVSYLTSDALLSDYEIVLIFFKILISSVEKPVNVSLEIMTTKLLVVLVTKLLVLTHFGRMPTVQSLI